MLAFPANESADDILEAMILDVVEDRLGYLNLVEWCKDHIERQ